MVGAVNAYGSLEKPDVVLLTSVVTGYEQNGLAMEAMEVMRLFHRMPKKDVVAWAAVISGLTQNGFPDESLQVFKCMLLDDNAPDAVMMVKVLTACSESGVPRQAICLHGYLVRSGFDNKVFVAAALLDLYSKCRNLDSATRVFESTTEKDVVQWSSMIAGYGAHGLGQEAVKLLPCTTA
jgi:pentatricopeptide repeat protein